MGKGSARLELTIYNSLAPAKLTPENLYTYCLLLQECLKNLKKQFPDSVKVSMLQGLYLEAEEKLVWFVVPVGSVVTFLHRYSEANTLYDEIIDAHPSCSAAWKRKVAILVARGKMLEAIKELNEFLNV